MQPPNTVRAEVVVDTALVVRLLKTTAFTGPVRPFATGWDNALFRVGEHHLARIPRRALGASALLRERAVLPCLPNLPVRVPEHLVMGEPTEFFPFPWTVTTFDPTPVSGHRPIDLGGFRILFDALHVPAPPSVPRDGARARPLEAKEPVVRPHLETLGLRAIWEEALSAPEHSGPAVFCHGDLHPFNLLGAPSLSAVIDWGDAFAGDPAPDYAALWMCHPDGDHSAFMSDEAYVRGRGWAVYYAAVLHQAVSEGAASWAPIVERLSNRLRHDGGIHR